MLNITLKQHQQIIKALLFDNSLSDKERAELIAIISEVIPNDIE